MVADPTTTLQVKNTGSLSVNRYGWINIWMAILGQFFTQFPLFFESCLILLKTWLEIFPDNAGGAEGENTGFLPGEIGTVESRASPSEKQDHERLGHTLN